MKRILVVTGLLLLAFTITASAATYDELVPHVLGFEIPTGQYCVTDYRDGKPFTVCYCACEPDCEESEPQPTLTVTSEPQPTPTDKPEPTPTKEVKEK